MKQKLKKIKLNLLKLQKLELKLDLILNEFGEQNKIQVY